MIPQDDKKPVTAVAELTGAQLDYWTARAEGIPAEQLTIRQVPRTDCLHVVLEERDKIGATTGARVLSYSTDWAQAGPLVEKHEIGTEKTGTVWTVHVGLVFASGDTPLQAICRAVVRTAFGETVPDEVRP